MIESNKPIFKAHRILDEKFISKFLFAVDSHFQIWLKQFWNAKNRNKVDDNIINFSTVVSKVLFGFFHINLLPTFRMKDPTITATESKSDAPNSSNEGGSKQKKRRKT